LYSPEHAFEQNLRALFAYLTTNSSLQFSHFFLILSYIVFLPYGGAVFGEHFLEQNLLALALFGKQVNSLPHFSHNFITFGVIFNISLPII